MKDLIIIGAGGFGREAVWVAERINERTPEWNMLGFLDDSEAMQAQEVGGYPVLGKLTAAAAYPDAYYLCAIGSSRVRERIVSRMQEILPKVKYAVLIDPTVQMSKRVQIGEGTIVCAGSILTVDIVVGSHVLINLDCTVGHDSVISDFVTLFPSVNVSGMTQLGRCAELGTGTQMIPQKTIGAGAVIGAGSVVIKDIPENCTAVGSPCKPIKYFD